MKYLGLNGAYIPREDIPFLTEELMDNDIIYSDYGERLLYKKDDRSYLFINNDCTRFLIRDGLTNWKKEEGQ